MCRICGLKVLFWVSWLNRLLKETLVRLGHSAATEAGVHFVTDLRRGLKPRPFRTRSEQNKTRALRPFHRVHSLDSFQNCGEEAVAGVDPWDGAEVGAAGKRRRIGPS